MKIVRQRLHGTLLAGRLLASGPDVVQTLGAVQAQDYDGAKWALGQRTQGESDAGIERAFTAGEILRTHVLRPTWHFVDPVDIRWMLALTGPHVKRTMASYDRKLELDEGIFRRSNRALVAALRDGRFLTRTELKVVLEQAKLGPLGVQRTAHLMMRAELEAIVCSGPRRGRQFTYALLDERVPPASPLDRDAALLALALRYFDTRGPATARDFNWWSGLPMADVRRAIDLARPEIEKVEIDGETYWSGGVASVRTTQSAHLLPNYDEFFIGYRDRSAIGRRLAGVNMVTGGNALIAHVVAVNGQLVGGWRRSVARDHVRLDFNLLDPLTPEELARVTRQVDRYAAFLGTEARITRLHAVRGPPRQTRRTAAATPGPVRRKRK